MAEISRELPQGVKIDTKVERSVNSNPFSRARKFVERMIGGVDTISEPGNSIDRNRVITDIEQQMESKYGETLAKVQAATTIEGVFAALDMSQTFEEIGKVDLTSNHFQNELNKRFPQNGADKDMFVKAVLRKMSQISSQTYKE